MSPFAAYVFAYAVGLVEGSDINMNAVCCCSVYNNRKKKQVGRFLLLFRVRGLTVKTAHYSGIKVSLPFA